MSGVLKPLLVPKEADNVDKVGAIHIDAIKQVRKRTEYKPGSTGSQEVRYYNIEFIIQEYNSDIRRVDWQYVLEADRDLEYSALLGCLATQIDRDSVNSLLSC